MQYQSHPYADLFPMMSDEETASFELNLKTHGLIEKIVLYQGQILDGRNRYKACLALGIEPVFEEFQGDDEKALNYVISKNLERRHLTSQQRAVVAIQADDFYILIAEQAKYARSKSGGDRKSKDYKKSVVEKITQPIPEKPDESKTRQKVAKAFKTNANYVSKAKKVQNNAPELLAEVKTGNLDLNEAVTVAKQREKEVKGAMQEVGGKKPEAQPLLELTQPVADFRSGIETFQENGYTLHVWHDGAKNPTFNTANESIDWAWSTWNPVTGCLHGCNYCYAAKIATNERMASAYPKGFDPVFHPYRLDAPKNSKLFSEEAIAEKAKERRLDISEAQMWAKNVFVCSMADLFGKWVPEDWIMRVFDSVVKYDQWNYLFLTKYPQRLQEIGEKLGGSFPANCWVGTTVDEQKRVRIAQDAFANIKATVKWLSLEPLLTKLEFTDLGMFDIVAIGGETDGNPYCRSCGQVDPHRLKFTPPWEWVESILWQARQSDTAVYFKENLKSRPKELPF